jgi:hypothetical protein
LCDRRGGIDAFEPDGEEDCLLLVTARLAPKKTKTT